MDSTAFHVGLGTKTAYATDTDDMEITYWEPQRLVPDPLFTAKDMAPIIDLFTSYPPTAFTAANSPNPYGLAPESLELWTKARAALVPGEPGYFYKMVGKHKSHVYGPGRAARRKRKPEESFAVRNQKATLEIEDALSALSLLSVGMKRTGNEADVKRAAEIGEKVAGARARMDEYRAKEDDDGFQYLSMWVREWHVELMVSLDPE